MSDPLTFEESPIYVSTSDELVYSTDTEDYGGSPTDVSQTAINLSTGKTVTSTIIDGTPTVSDDTITWATIKNFILYQKYGIDLTFTCGSNTFRRRLIVKCQM